MTKRYEIWDKKTPVITPVGKVFTAKQWMEKHPLAQIDTMKVVCQKGDINGGFFGVLSQMKMTWEAQGLDFSTCTTDEEILEAIEAAEDAVNAPSDEASAEERIAAALEAQNLMAMEDVETETATA